MTRCSTREHDAGAAARGSCPPRPAGRRNMRIARPWKKRGQPPGRVEEVERVARRRRVEHEHVEVAVLVELVELRDRGELLRAGDRARELLVDPVREDLVARARRPARAARSARRTCAWRRASSPTARRRTGVERSTTARLVAELVEPERVGEPPRRVDRHHGDLQRRARPARARRAADGRRLADAAGPGADDDPLALEQRLDESSALTDAVSDQALAHGERDGLRAAAGVELGHDVVQDVLHGALGIGELQGDLAGGMARRRSAPAPAARGRSGGRATGRPSAPFCRQPREQVAEQVGRHARRCRWPPPAPRRPAPPASASSLRRKPTAPACSAREHRVLARRRTSTRSRARRSPRATAPTKSPPPGTATGSTQHEVGREQRRVLPCL